MENKIDVKDWVKEERPIRRPFLNYQGFSADDAFARLKIIRKFKADLGIDINKYTRLMPEDVRACYEDMYDIMLKIEKLEAEYVACGE